MIHSLRVIGPIATSSRAGPSGDLRTFLDLRPTQQVRQQGHEQDQQDTERGEAEEPLRPDDVDSYCLLGDAERSRVRGERGQEHRAGHRRRREGGPHHVRANPPRSRSGLGAVEARYVADDRIDRSTAARRVRRRRRGEHQVGERDRVAESECAPPKHADQQQRDALAESALAVSDREDERADDQPDRALREPGKHPPQRLVGIRFNVAEQPRGRQSDQPDRAHGHRLEHEPGDDRGEDREVVPLVGLETLGYRDQVQRPPNDDGRQGPPVPFHGGLRSA